jgi:hypothetical protein
MEAQKTLNNEAMPSKKNDAGGITTLNFRIYYRPIAIKTAWYWHKKQTQGPIGQNRRP